MKRIALTAALALTIATPTFAQSQLERSIGAADGQYTIAQQVRLAFAQSETGLDEHAYFGGTNGHSARAAAIFASLLDEDTGTQPAPVQAGKNLTISSMGGHNSVARAIFAELLAAEDKADK